MNKKLIISSVALACVSGNANAADKFVEFGQCHFNQVMNGVFWQEGLYTMNHLQTECLSFGLSGKLEKFWNANPNWGWRVGFLVSSSWSNRSNIATYRDDEISKDPSTMHCATVPEDGGHGCFTVHSGAGNMRAVFASLTYRLQLPDGWFLVPEVGLSFYRMKQDASVTWYGDVVPSYAPGNYNVGENKDVFMRSPAPFAGLSFGKKNFYVFVRHFESQGGHPLTLADGTFLYSGVGVKF